MLVQRSLWVLWLIGRAAATEIGVLQDVLAVAHEKRYLVLDPMNSEATDQRNLPVLLMLARKKVCFCIIVMLFVVVYNNITTM